MIGWKKNPRYVWEAISNRLKGYKFAPTQFYRCCGHTTPFHYRTCQANNPAAAKVGWVPQGGYSGSGNGSTMGPPPQKRSVSVPTDNSSDRQGG